MHFSIFDSLRNICQDIVLSSLFFIEHFLKSFFGAVSSQDLFAIVFLMLLILKKLVNIGQNMAKSFEKNL